MTENAPTSRHSAAYARAGVDTAAGDRAVELMKAAVAKTHGPQVTGAPGGFAGLYDVSFLRDFQRPLLATSTDGIGTKIAIAQALDKHDTIGQDLVGMVVDDIIVVGAKPAFMTDYIACGKVVPERIADIVRGIAEGCRATGTALIGGETAEHPGLMGDDDYDVAGAAVGAVEADRLLGAARVRNGDVVLALASSGLHSNGFSLVRRILADRGIALTDHVDEFGGIVGEALLEPTRLYSGVLGDLLDSPLGEAVHSLSHVTGGGLASNLGRVLPSGTFTTVDRATWSPSPVFRVLASMAGETLEAVETTWNLGIGMFAIVAPDAAADIARRLTSQGIDTWQVGEVSIEARFDLSAADSVGGKGAEGGAVQIVGAYRP